MLIDSNIIIYAAMPEHAALRQIIADQAPVLSVISRVEVLGYHLLDDKSRSFFEEFFAAAIMLPLSETVIEQAIKLRQLRKMKLGDVLVAATAIVFGHSLMTRNTADFKWITDLKVVDPFATQE